MKLTLRIITVLCYFLPCCFFFITCNDFTIEKAYNQKDADSITKLSSKQIVETAKDTAGIGMDTPQHPIASYDIKVKGQKDDTATINVNNDDFTTRLISPSKNALSAVGALFYFKNLTGEIAIAIAMLLSLTLLVAYRWLKKPKVKMILLLIAILSTLVFMIDALISNVTLLFGVWVLLGLNVWQYWLEWREWT